MFSGFFRTKLEWRRVAVYEPVTIAGTGLVNADGSDRQSILATCHAGMRVVVCRQVSDRDPHGVGLFVNEGRQIGHLPDEVAEWVAPLLDSGMTAFDAEIWSLDPSEEDQGAARLTCRVMLTQHDLVPISRFSWTAWLRGGRRSRKKIRVRTLEFKEIELKDRSDA